MAECKKCKIQYCGKAETKLNITLNNNRKWLKDKVLTCELIRHFATHPNHDFKKDISITIIEQLTSGNLNTAQKKEVLKNREKFWQAKLKTLAPHGPNARLASFLISPLLYKLSLRRTGLCSQTFFYLTSSTNRTLQKAQLRNCEHATSFTACFFILYVTYIQ